MKALFKKYKAIFAIILITIVVFGIQIWFTWVNSKQIDEIVSGIETMQDQSAKNQKTVQEMISLRIQNEMKTLFLSRLVSIFGPMITTLVALIGVLMGLSNYLDTKEKDRLDRAVTDLRYILEQLASDEPRVRAMGIVGLQHFFVPDKSEYHLRALSALVTVARLEEDEEVRRCIRIAAEEAVQALPASILRQVSWQKAYLKKADFSGHDLSFIDFRDATLEDTNLSECDLSGAQLMATSFKGANLEKCNLNMADCTYADFAGARLTGTKFAEAILNDIKVLHMDVQGADFQDAHYSFDDMQWDKIKNWRDASFDKGVKDELIKRYGPVQSGSSVLMLMWEIPPFVVGGSWTACYHIVRKLRQRGADVTVVVPWKNDYILSTPFGCDVEVVSLGMTPPGLQQTEEYMVHDCHTGQPVGAYGYSPYGNTASYGYSPYSTTCQQPYYRHGFSPYQQSTPYGYSPYSQSNYQSYGSPYSQTFYQPYSSPYGQSHLHTGRKPHNLRYRSSVLYLSEEYKKRFLRLVPKRSFDIVHAHDWITFGAAKAGAQKSNTPWIAHFHSTETERRSEKPDLIIQRIEQDAVANARHIITPSKRTADAIRSNYNLEDEKISVVPNPLSSDEISALDMGSFESKQVVFLGRLAPQKGINELISIVKKLKYSYSGITFQVFGEGELEHRFYNEGLGNTLRGFIEWEHRGEAFSGASVVIMTSKSEPFGMVALEAMLHGVPVLYPPHAGVAEVMDSGITINPSETDKTVEKINTILNSWDTWVEIVKKQSEEIAEYPERGYEKKIIELWETMSG